MRLEKLIDKSKIPARTSQEYFENSYGSGLREPPFGDLYWVTPSLAHKVHTETHKMDNLVTDIYNLSGHLKRHLTI